MANKLVILAALFAASVAFAAATTYTTVVTTIVEDDGNQGSQQQCQDEMRRIDPNRCQQYFMERQGRILASPVEVVVGQQEQQQVVQECCNQIHQVSPQCRCQAIGYALGRLQQQPGMSQQGQALREKAEMLPQLCRFQEPTQCSFRAVHVSLN